MDTLAPDDIEFLRSLANELKTQNTYGTAKPVFIQARTEKKIFGIDLDCADHQALLIGDEHDAFYTVEEAKEHLYEYFDIEAEQLSDIDSFDEIVKYCGDRDIPCFIGGYNDSHVLSGCFLTMSGYEQHMKLNRHNYDGKTEFWVDHIWRNPQLERLLAIVEKFASEGESQ